MTKEQKLVYVRGILLQTEILMHSMLIANQERKMLNEPPIYSEGAFLALIDKFGIHHNSLITELVDH